MARDSKKSGPAAGQRTLSKRGDIPNWTDDELIDEASWRYHVVNVVECFGSKDVLLLELCLRELEGRGYDVDDYHSLVITKPEED